MNKKISVSLALTLVFIAMTVTFSVTMVVSMQMFDNTITAINEKETMFSNLSEINTYVASTDYYDYSYDTVYDTVASGYILGVSDPYARYYTAKAFAEYQDIQNGSLLGIGLDLVKDSASGYARVLRVYAESPAQEAGLKRDCYITAITLEDGTRYEVKSISDTAAVLARLRGAEGTTVTLDYIGVDGALVQDLTVTHHRYSIPTVESQLVGSCGYVRIFNFRDTTAAELDRALQEMQNGGAQAMVFDLRDNAGENLEAAMAAVDKVVGVGPLAAAEDKTGAQTILHTSDEEKCSLPMVCLVNGSTGSGAELFASCVKQMEGGSIVGNRTAGRGTIQGNPQRMSNGSAVVVTVARLLLVDSEGEFFAFEGEGLLPDIEAALSTTEEQNYYDLTVESDSQIQQAVAKACSMAGIGNTAGMEGSSGGALWPGFPVNGIEPEQSEEPEESAGNEVQ